VIPDKIFKALEHKYKKHEVFLKGGNLEKGYRPDYVLKKGNDYIILESENTSSRKTFVGGLIKAAHFLTENKTGILVFVIVPKKNTTGNSIVKHLKPYYKWIKDKTNLKKVYIIEANKYYAKEKVLEIATKEFHDNSYTV
jgi:hypothetical protein